MTGTHPATDPETDPSSEPVLHLVGAAEGGRILGCDPSHLAWLGRQRRVAVYPAGRRAGEPRRYDRTELEEVARARAADHAAWVPWAEAAAIAGVSADTVGAPRGAARSSTVGAAGRCAPSDVPRWRPG